jgi:hypothetical protein
VMKATDEHNVSKHPASIYCRDDFIGPLGCHLQEQPSSLRVLPWRLDFTANPLSAELGCPPAFSRLSICRI